VKKEQRDLKETKLHKNLVEAFKDSLPDSWRAGVLEVTRTINNLGDESFAVQLTNSRGEKAAAKRQRRDELIHFVRQYAVELGEGSWSKFRIDGKQKKDGTWKIDIDAEGGGPDQSAAFKPRQADFGPWFLGFFTRLRVGRNSKGHGELTKRLYLAFIPVGTTTLDLRGYTQVYSYFLQGKCVVEITGPEVEREVLYEGGNRRRAEWLENALLKAAGFVGGERVTTF
jgi:hypothetical protein